MGEVVNTEGVIDLEVRERETERKMKEDSSSSPATTVVRWERFLPRKVLRVLLVEADDSTRHIITALLRKCSYKVASVSDGLKAWEVLKGRPQSIDLILTEVDLPSISGFALLTLIMEHEICKKIPVIMMSSCDSVSTVYKCMLRGAADFLVKPVRINELKNLWQHVWRRQASSAGGHGPQDDSLAQQKVEATAENNATSNHSSGYMACIRRNRECIDKGTDAQSSCTKPDMEAERGCVDCVETADPKWSQSHENDINIREHGEYVQKLVTDNLEAEESAAACKNANTVTLAEDNIEPADMIVEVYDNNQALGNSSMEAVDLIGAIDNYPRFSFRISGSANSINKIDSSPHLDLSLRRSHPSGSVNQVTDERQMLHHSDASAFSRYINKEMQPLHSTSASNQQRDITTDKQLFSQGLNRNSDSHIPMTSTQNVLSLATGQSELPPFSLSQQKVFPMRVPVRGIRFENLTAAYGSVVPPIFCAQSGLSHQEPSCQVNPFQQSNLENQITRELHDLHDQNANNTTNQTEHKQWGKLECFDTDHSASSSFCNGGSNGNVSPVPIIRTAAESGNEGNIVHDGISNRYTLREAALTKFRLKRKDRCYEKKVRYETRKKLAEKRPRVKGQFVRQVLHNDLPSVETDNLCGNPING